MCSRIQPVNFLFPCAPFHVRFPFNLVHETSNPVGRVELTIKMFNSVEWPSIKFRMFLRVLDQLYCCSMLPLIYISTGIMLKRALVCPLLCFCSQFVVPAHLLHILSRRLSCNVTCCDSLSKVIVFFQYQSLFLSCYSVTCGKDKKNKKWRRIELKLVQNEIKLFECCLFWSSSQM